jgi:hypothetical protein
MVYTLDTGVKGRKSENMADYKIVVAVLLQTSVLKLLPSSRYKTGSQDFTCQRH